MIQISNEEYAILLGEDVEPKKGRNKHGSRKKEEKPKHDGYDFDSIPEFHQYIFRKDQLKQGIIKDLVVKPVFILREKAINKHGQVIPAWTYKPEHSFIIVEGNIFCVEDIKSFWVAKNGKKGGTSQERSYKLSKNELMRQKPEMKFIETIYQGKR